VLSPPAHSLDDVVRHGVRQEDDGAHFLGNRRSTMACLVTVPVNDSRNSPPL